MLGGAMALAAVCVGGSSLAADLALKVMAKEPPPELDASIRAVLQPQAIQLLEGDKPVFEFWLAKEAPIQSRPASVSEGLATLKQTTLLGAAAVHANRRDYKDNDLNTGVYTMRFALQPQDGNHLGTAEYPYFVVLTPPKYDSKLEGISDYKALVKASSKDTTSDHPVILSLRPVNAEAEAPALTEPAPEHKSVRVKVPAKAPGGEKSALVFELVFEGKGKI